MLATTPNIAITTFSLSLLSISPKKYRKAHNASHTWNLLGSLKMLWSGRSSDVVPHRQNLNAASHRLKQIICTQADSTMSDTIDDDNKYTGTNRCVIKQKNNQTTNGADTTNEVALRAYCG